MARLSRLVLQMRGLVKFFVVVDAERELTLAQSYNDLMADRSGTEIR
jgi:hypothetical protein